MELRWELKRAALVIKVTPVFVFYVIYSDTMSHLLRADRKMMSFYYGGISKRRHFDFKNGTHRIA